MKRILSALLIAVMALSVTAVLADNVPLAINQRVPVAADAVITQGDCAVIVDGTLCALASGSVTVRSGETETTYDVSPYVRVCGMAPESPFAGPVAVWADFNAATGELVHLDITGMGQPEVMAAYGADFAALEGQKDSYMNKSARAIAEGEAADVLAAAVRDACRRYLSEPAFDIRPYQSLMTDRYLANNPHFAELTADTQVQTAIAACWPEGCAVVETADVENNGKVTWPLGVTTASFKNGDATYTVSHNAVKGVMPGVAVISYTAGETTLLCAVEIYDNFTLTLSGSDAYGMVAAGPADKTADVLVYRVLGDKAMNFPGGTPGSTVIDVAIDRASRTILSVRITAHSDSPYLYNPWEYGGGFVSVGSQLYDIARFTNMFAGRSADSDVSPYVLSSQKNGVVGGVPVEGGIDLVVTGATRTPNAIVAAVNAALVRFREDTK